MPPKNARCPYCSKALPSQNTMRLHVSAMLSCNKTWKKQFSQENSKPPQDLPLKTHKEISALTLSLSEGPTDDEMDIIADNFNLPSTPTTPPPQRLLVETLPAYHCAQIILREIYMVFTFLNSILVQSQIPLVFKRCDLKSNARKIRQMGAIFKPR